MFHSVPCCYFPTQTVFIDEDQDLLNNISHTLGKHGQITVFTNPHKALHYLKQQSALRDEFLRKYVEEWDMDSNTDGFFKKGKTVDLEHLYKEVYNPERFKMPSIVVIDFTLSQIHGVELCTQLEETSYKILMLDSKADMPLAIELFNQSIIHQFILKDQENYLNELEKGIEKLKLQYFQTLSDKILHIVNADLLERLSDPGYIKKFYEILNNHDIVEFYLLDDSGSQLLLDKNGKPFWFFLKTEEDMDILLDFAQDYKITPQPIIQSIKNKEKLTHFFSVEESYNPTQWKLYDTHKIQGNNTYYYSLLDNIENNPLDSQKIIPYHKFLQSR